MNHESGEFRQERSADPSGVTLPGPICGVAPVVSPSSQEQPPLRDEFDESDFETTPAGANRVALLQV